jgi:putative ABC transport system permease protein
MACSIIILLWVQYESSFDRYHEKADRIYRLGMDLDIGNWHKRMAISSNPAGPALKKDYPEVLNFARFRGSGGNILVQYKDQKFFEKGILYADNSVFDIFTFPIIYGRKESALKTAFSIVISEAMAKKYFGGEDPLGKVLKLEGKFDFTVTAVIQNVPENSHFTFNMLVSYETYNQAYKEKIGQWLGDLDAFTYLLFQKNADLNEFDSKLPAFVNKYMGEDLKAIGGKAQFFLQPLTDIHLYSNLDFEISGNGRIAYVYTFLAIAFFILVIACINFMNLSTARSANRGKEVGVRKAIGAHRRELITQFMGETFLFSFISLIIALILVELNMPMFRSVFASGLSFNDIRQPDLFAGLFVLTLFVGFISGSYPALFLSAFQPLRVITGRLKSGAAGSHFRSSLVICQFTISIALIIATVSLFNQLHYMKGKQLGFEKEHVVVLRIIDKSIFRNIDFIKTELKRHPGIIGVAVSSHLPGHGARPQAVVPEGFIYNQSRVMDQISIDPDFIPIMGIEISSGRNFSHQLESDPGEAILINETAARQLGWNDPTGKVIGDIGDPIKESFDSQKRIIGVVKDFHIKSLHFEIEPLYLEIQPALYNFVLIKLAPGKISETMRFLENKWNDINPTQAFDYFFLDESFDYQYQTEQRLSTIFSYLTPLAIFIACLGLFGLASFTAEQRTKEIGIRKALGASVSNIVIRLSKEFTKWVLMANIIAWPIAYFAVDRWLQHFAYRFSIGIGTFITAALSAFVIAWLTVGYQAIKAARANPVEALRYE